MEQNKLPTFWDVAKAFKWAAEYRDEIGGELLLSNGQWLITPEDEDGNENEDKELTPGNVAELYCLQRGFEKEPVIDDYTALRAKCDKMELERYENRLALRMLLRAFMHVDLSRDQEKYYKQADAIFKKYHNVTDALRSNGDALEHSGEKEPTIPQQGAVWVKASEYDTSKGGVLFYRFDGPYLKGIGIGNFVGDVFHGINLDVPKSDWEYLFILDECGEKEVNNG